MATERRPIVLIGNTLHELSDTDKIKGYYNKSEIDTLLGNVSAGAIDIDYVMSRLPVYEKTEVDAIISTKADISEVYNKTEVLDLVSQKVSVGTVYAKNEVYSRSETYSKIELYSKEQTYSKAEIDSIITNIGGLTADDVYTKIEINTMMSAIPDMSTVATDVELEDMKQNILSSVNLSYIPKSKERTFITYDYANTNFVSLTNVYTKTEVDGIIDGLNVDELATQTWVNGKILDLMTGAGAIEIDLSNYYTRVQTQDLIDASLADFDGGGSDVDLTNYFTKLDTQTYVAVELGSYYDKTSIDSKLAEYYTRSQVDNLLATSGGGDGGSVDLSNYYTKDVADLKIQYAIDSNLPDMSDYYTKAELYSKTEIDTLLANFTPTDGGGGDGGTVDTSIVYTKTQIDTMLGYYLDENQVNTKLTSYALLADTFTKDESDARYPLESEVYSKTDSYSKTEVDTSVEIAKTELNERINAIDDTINGFGTVLTADLLEEGLDPIRLENYKQEEKLELLKEKINIQPKLEERDLITVTDASVKTYTVEYNPDFVQVFLNRNLLYSDEYTSVDGSSITFNIDLLVNDKIKVITSFNQMTVDYSTIDAITTIPNE